MTGLLSMLNPGWLLIAVGLGALFLPVRRVRQGLTIAAPIIAILLISVADRNVNLLTGHALGIEMILYRVDNLSYIFGLAFLLAAEVVAATAVVSEAVLVYVARVRNLWISIATIALQAILTVVLIEAMVAGGYGEPFKAAAAAIALMLALGTASLVKAMLLSKILGQRINTFRWPLVWAAAPAVLVGWLATRLPEWAELIIGIPAILGVYGFIIWRRGFGPEDRVLFKRNLDKEEAAAAD